MLVPTIRLGVVRQLLASFSCSLSLAVAGVTYMWFTPLMMLIVSDKSPVPMTTLESSWLVSSAEISSFLSVIPAGMIADKIGRRYPLLVLGPLCAVSFLLQAYTRSLSILFALRQIHGICLGVAFTCSPIYIAEVSEPWLRGFNTANTQTMFYLGGLFAYCIGPYLSYKHYALVSLVIPLIFTLSFTYMPESPYYLVMKGRNDKAQMALSWLRGDTAVEEELKAIQDTVEKETHNKGSWRELFLTRKERKAFLIVQVCSITKYLGSTGSFIIYVTQTFEEGTTAYLDHHQLTIVAGVLLSLSTFISSLISDSVGRRAMLIYSCMICFFFYILTGGYYFLDLKTDFDVEPYVTVLYVSVSGFIIAANIGLTPLMQTIQAEYFSSKTRGIGGAVTTAIASFLTFFSVMQYQYVSDTVGVYLNYWIFALVSLWGAAGTYFFIPEMAGLSLAEIEMAKTDKSETKL